LLYLSTGLAVGFGHCIGMCGPLVVSFSLSLRDQRGVIPHLFYHIGRILTYVILGGVMGAAGSFTRIAGHIEGVQKGAMFLAGFLVLLMGFAMTGWLPVGRIFGSRFSAGSMLTRAFQRMAESKALFAYLPIGLLLGLLPCGPVYTALLGAVRAGMEIETVTGSIAFGSILMLAFGAGTVPALLIVAKLTDMGWLRFRDRLYQIGGILMIGVGIYFIIGAIRY